MSAISTNSVDTLMNGNDSIPFHKLKTWFKTEVGLHPRVPSVMRAKMTGFALITLGIVGAATLFILSHQLPLLLSAKHLTLGYVIGFAIVIIGSIVSFVAVAYQKNGYNQNINREAVEKKLKSTKEKLLKVAGDDRVTDAERAIAREKAKRIRLE